LLRDIPQDSFFYFVHSYFAPIGDFNIGTCTYGESFSAIVVKDNFIGCQFHPERSGEMGSLLLKNFAEIKP
jgi:glutamine amidotransferase